MKKSTHSKETQYSRFSTYSRASVSSSSTREGLHEWLDISHGATGTRPWFVSVVMLRTAGLDNIRMFLDDAIGYLYDDNPVNYVATLATFFARLRALKLNLSLEKSRLGPACVVFLNHVIFSEGVRPNDDKGTVVIRMRMPMPNYIKQLRSLLGDLGYYYRKFLPNMARRACPAMAPLKKAPTTFYLTPEMEQIIRSLLTELATPPILIFP